MNFYLMLYLTNGIYLSYHPTACKTIPDLVQGMAKPAVDIVRFSTYSHHCSRMANDNLEKRVEEEEEEKGNTETEDNGVETEEEDELLRVRVDEEIESARRSVMSLNVTGEENEKLRKTKSLFYTNNNSSCKKQ